MKKETINIEKEVLAKARRARKGTLLFPEDLKGWAVLPPFERHCNGFRIKNF